MRFPPTCTKMVINVVIMIMVCCLLITIHVCDGDSTTKPPLTIGTTGTTEAMGSRNKVLLTYLQQEQVACNNAQQSIVHTLRNQYKIPIGLEPGSLLKKKKTKKQSEGEREGEGEGEREEDRITTSTPSNPIECRITLDRAPYGSTCIAPCGCSGSQKWIQFSIFNKLRRKNPQQWQTCQTCKQPFQYDLLVPSSASSRSSTSSSTKAMLIGLLLDNRSVMRGFGGVLMFMVSYLINVPKLITRLLVSEWFWQMYPRWAKVAHLPLALKIWVLRLGLQQIAERYVKFETNTIVDYLADIETKLLEEQLSVGDRSVDHSDDGGEAVLEEDSVDHVEEAVAEEEGEGGEEQEVEEEEEEEGEDVDDEHIGDDGDE